MRTKWILILSALCIFLLKIVTHCTRFDIFADFLLFVFVVSVLLFVLKNHIYILPKKYAAFFRYITRKYPKIIFCLLVPLSVSLMWVITSLDSVFYKPIPLTEAVSIEGNVRSIRSTTTGRSLITVETKDFRIYKVQCLLSRDQRRIINKYKEEDELITFLCQELFRYGCKSSYYKALEINTNRVNIKRYDYANAIRFYKIDLKIFIFAIFFCIGVMGFFIVFLYKIRSEKAVSSKNWTMW